MIVHIDPHSAIPVFEQLRSQIERYILSGQLAPGSLLPPIRQLAADLGIAKATVNKVYESLARVRLVESRGRSGTMVLDPGTRQVSDDDVAEAARRFALIAAQTGMSEDDAIAALRKAWR